ncbi:ATP-dependent helicase [Neisseria sp. HMSC066H01]|uniref:SNF2-related protein n=1 Tax=Neisseria sp. HMSC066H01 TaxID=1715031 RepID=UPI0008A99C36|nr:SNF2-related protein [Neisseria sp. HMSC066H01]OHQ24419.1 ATP-dependent helicase [Neisseria sp. HMSC066H01]
MNITPHQAKYYAHQLLCQKSGDERLSQALFEAQVDLQPHQIDAALFALENPLREGVLLADEVGLGKTIEAGLVLCQLWAERKRRLLVVCPAALRKQWQAELREKFSLPSLVLDKAVLKQQNRSLIDFLTSQAGRQVLVVSYEFATKCAAEINAAGWDLAVFDEAHKLRNVYKGSSKQAQTLLNAFADSQKLLLSATPLQNSLMEFYGLSLFLDEHLFGSKKEFQKCFINRGDTDELRTRLSPYVKRTLRKDVLEYIRYTRRHTITQNYRLNDDEYALYMAVSDFLAKGESYALPKRQRHLTGLVLRKLLASSTPALSGTLGVIRQRLDTMQKTAQRPSESLFAALDEDLEYWEAFDDEGNDSDAEPIDFKLLAAEIAEMDGFIKHARALTHDSKAQALLQALKTGFQKMQEADAADKAVIFTESVRTQEYLFEFLGKNGYEGQIVLFSGDNKHPDSQWRYKAWLDKNAGSPHHTGSPAVDKRTALIDAFKNQTKIMIATESAAEGVNLQFCSLLINYDLPWNPQRIEQRIGRCHRYGQKSDVVVINFLNTRNDADRRVLELLTDKFKLFDGVFGASDEILGRISDDLDFEKRILAIYDNCRTPEAITAAFDRLQKEMEDSIAATRNLAEERLLQYFDTDVHERFKTRLQQTRKRLDDFQRWFWLASRFALNNYAAFNPQSYRFDLKTAPEPHLHLGVYSLLKDSGENETAALHRPNTDLGQWCIDQCKTADTPNAEITFNYGGYSGGKISILAQNQGKSGWLSVEKIKIHSQADAFETLLFTARTDDGEWLDDDFCQKLLLLGTKRTDRAQAIPSDITQSAKLRCDSFFAQYQEQNNRYYYDRVLQFDRWAEDQKAILGNELEEIKTKIKTIKRERNLAQNTAELAQYENQIRKLEQQKRHLRNTLDDKEDEIDEKHDLLIRNLQLQTTFKSEFKNLFTIKWRIE